MKTLTEIETEIGIWAFYNFGSQNGLNDLAPLMGIVEEIGELYHIRLKQLQGIRKLDDPILHERDAIGDILVCLLDYCYRRGYQAEDVLNEIWNKVKQRDWKKFPKDGMTE